MVNGNLSAPAIKERISSGGGEESFPEDSLPFGSFAEKITALKEVIFVAKNAAKKKLSPPQKWRWDRIAGGILILVLIVFLFYYVSTVGLNIPTGKEADQLAEQLYQEAARRAKQ